MGRPGRPTEERPSAAASEAEDGAAKPDAGDEIAALERRLDGTPPASENGIELAARPGEPEAEPERRGAGAGSKPANRLLAELEGRERALSHERQQKLRYIEASDRRLKQIEESAARALERLSSAELHLSQQGRLLREQESERAGELERAAEERLRSALSSARGETERRVRAEQAERLRAEIDRLRAEADAHEQRAVGAAREEADRRAASDLAARRSELERERAEHADSLAAAGAEGERERREHLDAIRAVRAELERERRDRADAIADAERRAHEAAERSRTAERAGAEAAAEARSGAADWLRKRTEALRREHSPRESG